MWTSSSCVLVLLVAGCAHISDRPLSPLGLSHAREGFRRVLTGAAIVLPILDCDSRQPGVEVNIDARRLTRELFPPEIWKQLGMPGAVEEGRVDESDALCNELADSRDRGTNLTLVSPVM